MDVQVQGVGELVNRLARFDKDVYRLMTSEIKQSMRFAAADIKADMPPERALTGTRKASVNGRTRKPSKGWGPWNDSGTRRSASQRGVVSLSAFSGRDLGFDGARVGKSVAFGAKQARIRGVGVVGVRGWAGIKDAGGSVFTTAGHKTPETPFNRALIGKFGNQYPRVLARIWVARKDSIGAEIDAAIDRARRAVGL